ncbi:MAG: saccharopine dehydrogenase NADP-binding domain-containing protein [Pseudomonadota bacterium]
MTSGTETKPDALMLYGAYGYTGRLVTERARTLGLQPIIAGRDAARVKALADEHALDWRAFPLDGAVDSELAGVAAVLNMAGPFSRTAAPMVAACLRTGTHYIDITGEIDIFTALHGHDAAARAAGVVLLPGAGFDVVPSDCIAAHVHRRLPGAQSLQIVIGGLNDLSRGTARTGLESIAAGTAVRRDGEIVRLPKAPRDAADFGDGLRPIVGVGWGDVATAHYSTGIPDIDVFFEASPALDRAASMPAPVRAFMGSRLGQWLGNRAIDRMPPGPNETARRKGRAILIAEAADAEGNSATARLETPEGYRLTAMTALDIARRVAAGEVAPGYHTPSTAFGPDYILGFPDVARRDL